MGKDRQYKDSTIHFHSNAGVNVAGAKLILDLDHSGCVNCTFICKNVKYICDSFPGLRSVIEQRSKRHPEYSSGDSNQGRIPGQYRRLWCEVGDWGYHKLFPVYSEASNQKFKEALKKDLELDDRGREFIDYNESLKERINRIKNGEITALYERESHDYYKYATIRKKLRTYYKFPVTIERSYCETCHASRAYVLLEGKSTLGKWYGPVDKYPNPLYSIAGIYERSGEKHPRPAGLQGFDENYETEAVEDEYGEYDIEGPGELRKEEDDLPWGLASRDKERDPGDYAVANDKLDQEYEDEDDTWVDPYRKRDSYVNELPYRRKTNKKHVSQAARTARDGFGSNYPILGTRSECGGNLAKGITVWNSHATKYIMQDFVDIHRDDIVCVQCGLIHKLPADGSKITPAIERCLLDGTLQNDGSIYVPFDLELYEKSRASRKGQLEEYYKNNPDAKKPPKDKDLALPKQECYKKHDRLTLKDPEKGLKPEQIKRRQIVRTITEMWSREELPDDPIMAVMDSTIKQGSFSKKFKELYDEKLSNRAVVRKMEMAQNYQRERNKDEIRKIWTRMRKHHRQENIGINLGNFIKS